MLNLTRKVGQRVEIGDRVVITVAEVRPDGRVKLAIEAPRDVPVLRAELDDVTKAALRGRAQRGGAS